MSDPKLPFSTHDHSRCVDRGMDAAREMSAARRIRLTPVRARVLEILLESHRALGAYEVLERLRTERDAAQPPVAYRALDFLVANGFAHRIERLNAFIACAHPDLSHRPAFLICTDCGTVAEMPAAEQAGGLQDEAAAMGFDLHNTIVEAEGLCPECRPNT